MRMYSTILAAFFVTSCALATAPDTGESNMVTLPSVSLNDAVCTKHVGGSVMVVYPVLAEDLDTYRIAILDKGRRDYLASMRWSGFLPSIVQSAFTQSLNDAGTFKNAFTDNEVEESHWQLLTDIRQFEVIYAPNGAPSNVAMEMQFTLATDSGVATKKHFTLSQLVTIEANNASAITQAFRKAFGNMQKDLIAKLAGCREQSKD